MSHEDRTARKSPSIRFGAELFLLMTAKLGVDGTVPSPELLPDTARNFEHGGVSVAGNGLHGEAENVKDGNEAGADSGGRIPERDTSGEVQYIQAPSDLARWNLRGSRLRSPKLDIQLQFSDQDEDRGGDTEDDLADRDGAKAELGPAPQQAVSEGWESFLPQRHLRVLLVEDDDSTRHVVAALLRNCCYEGTSAAVCCLFIVVSLERFVFPFRNAMPATCGRLRTPGVCRAGWRGVYGTLQ